MNTPEAEHLTSTIVEGIGDDVVHGVVLLISGLIPVFGAMYFWQQRRSQEQSIHPQSQATVDDTREHLAQQQEQQDVQNGHNSVGQQPSTSTTPSVSSNYPRRRHGDGNCPVCISNLEYAVETNCGHMFCGICIITYWRHGNWMGAVRCPVCRQQVTVLLRCFAEDEQRLTTPRKEEVNHGINAYNRRFSGEPVPWMDSLRDLPTLLRHLVAQFFSVGGLIWVFRLRIILCFFIALLYFISPVDFIPEAAFGFLGLLDDMFILLLLAIYTSIIYRRYLAAQADWE